MISTPTMQEMLEAGVHFGHKVSRGNPRMKPFIYGARDGIHIIDLAQSEQKLKEAAEFVYELGKNSGTLLIVGTKKQAREIVETLAKQAQTPYLNIRWVGGLLTNFDEVRRNITKLNGLKKEQVAGTLSHYTKKEQLLLARKLEKFEREIGGVAEMDKLPGALFVLDCASDQTAVREAIRTGIPLVGVSDSNANPDQLDYPIPANDDGIKSIKLILEAIVKAYQDGKKEGLKLAEKAEKKRLVDEEKAKVKKAADDKAAEEKAQAEAEAALASPALEEAAALEEEIEKKTVEESERKTD